MLIEATRAIREFENAYSRARKQAQITALTALDDEKHRQRAFEASVDDFITKPVKMARIRHLVKQAWDDWAFVVDGLWLVGCREIKLFPTTMVDHGGSVKVRPTWAARGERFCSRQALKTRFD